MAKVITILADGFEEVEALTYVDLLRRASIDVIMLGLTTIDVRGSHDIVVRTDGLLKDFDGTYDGIVLPGGQPGTTNLTNSPEVIELVKKTHQNGLLCAAICAAPSVFAKAGILKGVHVTSYPSVKDKLEGSIYEETPVVHDGKIITSRGVGTAIAFALELITFFCGEVIADKVASAIIYKA